MLFSDSFYPRDQNTTQKMASDDESTYRAKTHFRSMRDYRNWYPRIVEKIPTEDDKRYAVFSGVGCISVGVSVVIWLAFFITLIVDYDVRLRCKGYEMESDWFKNTCIRNQGDVSYLCGKCPYDLIRAPIARDMLGLMSLACALVSVYMGWELYKTPKGKKCMSPIVYRIAQCVCVVAVLCVLVSIVYLNQAYSAFVSVHPV
jgi:hypothetical protein